MGERKGDGHFWVVGVWAIVNKVRESFFCIYFVGSCRCIDVYQNPRVTVLQEGWCVVNRGSLSKYTDRSCMVLYMS